MYDRYVKAIAYVVMAWAGGVVEPADQWSWYGHSGFSKEDFKNGASPCLLAVSPKTTESYWDLSEFTRLVGDKNVLKIYYGQPWDEAFVRALEDAGCLILGVEDSNPDAPERMEPNE